MMQFTIFTAENTVGNKHIHRYNTETDKNSHHTGEIMEIRKLAFSDLEQLDRLYYQFWGENSDIEKMKNRFRQKHRIQKKTALNFS